MQQQASDTQVTGAGQGIIESRTSRQSRNKTSQRTKVPEDVRAATSFSGVLRWSDRAESRANFATLEAIFELTDRTKAALQHEMLQRKERLLIL